MVAIGGVDKMHSHTTTSQLRPFPPAAHFILSFWEPFSVNPRGGRDVVKIPVDLQPSLETKSHSSPF